MYKSCPTSCPQICPPTQRIVSVSQTVFYPSSCNGRTGLPRSPAGPLRSSASVTASMQSGPDAQKAACERLQAHCYLGDASGLYEESGGLLSKHILDACMTFPNACMNRASKPARSFVHCSTLPAPSSLLTTEAEPSSADALPEEPQQVFGSFSRHGQTAA